MKNSTRLLATSAVASMLAISVPATAAPYFTGTQQFIKLGDTIGSDFDKVTLGGVTGDFTGAGTYLLNTVTFEVGINSNDSHTNVGVLAGNTGDVGGNPFTYGVNYTIQIANSDTILLGGNTFRVGDFYWSINPLTLTSGGETVNGSLIATVTAVPEPATWAMMIIGFGLVGAGMRSRRRQTVRVTYA